MYTTLLQSSSTNTTNSHPTTLLFHKPTRKHPPDFLPSRDSSSPSSSSSSSSSPPLTQHQPTNTRPQLSNSERFKEPWYYQLSSGAIAGATSAVIVSPLDVARIRLQIMGEQNQSSLAIIRDIAKKEGFRSLVSGLPTNLIALVPNWMSYFLAYSQFRAHTSDTLLPIIGPSGFDLVSAMVGGTACTICTHPLWLVKARFQVQGLKQRYGDNAPTPIHRTGYFPPTATDPTSHLSKCTSSKTAVNTASSHSDIIYSSTFDALKQIFKSGGLRGLYAGFFPQLLGLLHVGVHFPLYERTKRELYLWNCRMNPNSDDALHGTDYLHHNQQLNSNRSSDPNLHLSQLNLLDPSLKNHLSATQIVIASTISKTIASTIAYPHEIIRSRFQTQDFLDINKANPTLEASQPTTSPAQPQQPQQPQPLNNKSPSNSTLHHDHPTQQRIKYTSIPHAIRNIYQTEGIHGFYRGLNVTLLRSVPASIVTFLVYEEMMVLLKKNGTAYPKWLKEQESKLTNQNMEKFKA